MNITQNSLQNIVVESNLINYSQNVAENGSKSNRFNNLTQKCLSTVSKVALSNRLPYSSTPIIYFDRINK